MRVQTMNFDDRLQPQSVSHRLQPRSTEMKKIIAVFLLMLTTVVSATGEKYKRPKVDVPGSYRGAPVTQTGQAASQNEASIGDQKWWEVFQDQELQQLIRTALQENYDVRIAATRILEAQAQLGITRSDQLPTIGAGATAVNERSPRQKNLPPEYNTSNTTVGASFSWDLDFWGKYRHATEAARANLLATEWARRAVTSTLVSNVAAAYFELRAYDLQLEIAKRTLASRQESLQLTKTLADGGAGTELDVRQAEQL